MWEVLTTVRKHCLMRVNYPCESFFGKIFAGNYSGLSYVYTIQSSTGLWTQLGVVYPSNGTDARYGSRTSLSSFNNYAIVGAYSYGTT